jgi:hypothetical protein
MPSPFEALSFGLELRELGLELCDARFSLPRLGTPELGRRSRALDVSQRRLRAAPRASRE